MSELVVATRENDVLVLTLNCPDRRNVLSTDMALTLTRHVSCETDARAIVLTGAPPVFCAGGDLNELLETAAAGPLAVGERVYGVFQGLVRSFISSPLPIIAAVNGLAVGAGMDLAMACDVRVASRSAAFASSWIALGLVPGMGGASLLAASVTASDAALALLTGRRIDGETALRIGLVSAVTDEDPVPQAVSIAQEITAHPAVAVAATKAALRRALDAGLANEFTTLAAQQSALITGPDFHAAAERFTNRQR